MAAPRPIHEEFSSSYANAGIQPTLIRNVQVSYKEPKQTETAQVNTPTSTPLRQVRKTLKKTAAAKGLKLARKVKVSTTNATIFSWALPLWLTIQLPFALISLIMLGMGSLFHSVLETFREETGFLGSIFTITADVLSWAASKLGAGFSYITGIDINVLNISESLFIICYLLVFAVGLLTLMGITLQYILTLHKPLSGQAAGLKMGMFMLALIGYFLPIANLFPWSLFYMAVVWKYPN